MPFTFPMALADFWSLLPIASIRLDIDERKEQNALGGGEIFDADLGAPLWQAEIKLGEMDPTEAQDAEVLLDLVRPAGRTFFVTDLLHKAPRDDPTGSILGAATPTLTTYHPDMRSLKLTGLPDGYKLRRGDYVSYSYDGGRRAMHRVVSLSVAAPASGETPYIEVQPSLRLPATTGLGIILLSPRFAAKIVPGSVNKGDRGSWMTTGASFKIIQTLGKV